MTQTRIPFQDATFTIGNETISYQGKASAHLEGAPGDETWYGSAQLGNSETGTQFITKPPVTIKFTDGTVIRLHIESATGTDGSFSFKGTPVRDLTP